MRERGRKTESEREKAWRMKGSKRRGEIQRECERGGKKERENEGQ